MSTFDSRPVKLGPKRNCSVGWTGGGPIVDYYLPAFQALGAGTTIKIQFLDAAGAEIINYTYDVPTSPVGLLALVRHGGTNTFLEDVQVNQFGFIATAIGGAILIGRCGLDTRDDGSLKNTACIEGSADEPNLPEELGVGQAFAWCCVADAHGWSVNFVDTYSGGGGGSGGLVGTPFSNALSTIAHGVAKASKGTLKSVYASNANVAVRYLQFFDQVADLGGGETPSYGMCYEIPAGNGTSSGAVLLDDVYLGGSTGAFFGTGIVWGVSTTKATFTAATAADHLVQGYYI